MAKFRFAAHRSSLHFSAFQVAPFPSRDFLAPGGARFAPLPGAINMLPLCGIGPIFILNFAQSTLTIACRVRSGIINLSTHQPINPSTHQPINLSTHQPINPSTYQLITPSTHSSSVNVSLLFRRERHTLTFNSKPINKIREIK